MSRALGLLLVVGLSACGSDDETTARRPVPTTAPVILEPEPELTTTTVPPSRELALGTEATTPLGNKVTVYAYEAPIPPGRYSSGPAPGKEYAAVDVGGCAGSEKIESGLNPLYFELVMPDNTRYTPSYNYVREPPLRSSPLAPVTASGDG